MRVGGAVVSGEPVAAGEPGDVSDVADAGCPVRGGDLPAHIAQPVVERAGAWADAVAPAAFTSLT